VTIIAKNYAEDSSNKMHSNETAGRYGYRGGLVPGVAVFAYMTRPIVEVLGEPWLAHGSMAGKFIKPVYDEEPVTVQSHVVSLDPIRITTSVLNEAGILCAVGAASMPDKRPHLDISKYPFRPLPEAGAKLSPTLEALADDTLLGSLEFTMDPEEQEGETGNFMDEMVDPHPIYRGPNALLHPAFWTQKGNQILVENVNLGPWIHTASDVNYYDFPKAGETIYVQGRVAHAYKKRGHDIAVIDIAVLGDKERPLAHLTHTAIVRPQEQAPE
jgi:hypothetical protein